MNIAGWAVLVSVMIFLALWARELFTHAPILIASSADFAPENDVVNKIESEELGSSEEQRRGGNT
ncbi:hypothetical protein J7K76_02550 [Candidatus Bipolaricaulota bacterium]|nr:hypothetical protein [Candidatus Bipolaricaulota bacterium]